MLFGITSVWHFVLFATSFLAVIHGQDLCPEMYKRFSEQHTYCKPANASCDLLGNSLSAEDAELIVQKHNEYRSKIAMGQENGLPKAADMLQMEWDNELAAVAQKHAEQCNFAHDCNSCRQTTNFYAGQNLYQSWTNAPSSKDNLPEPKWESAIWTWYEEVKDFNTNEVSSYENQGHTGAVGHFTQLIWSRSWKIGCGYAVFKQKGDTYQLYTCNYGPAGNMIGGAIYEKEDPCSKCPMYTCCGGSCNQEPTYNGLCKITSPSGPRYEHGKEYTYFCDFEDISTCSFGIPQGMKNWAITHTLSGSYIGVVLQRGEKSTLNFTKPFSSKGSSCLTVNYRKGPNVDGEQGDNEALEDFADVETGQNFEVSLSGDTDDFMEFGMNLSWESEFMFSVSFSVPQNAQAQYFEICQVSFREGKC